MKSLFSKIFGQEDQKDIEESSLIQLPPALPLDSLSEARKRSMIGGVAHRIAEQLNAERVILNVLMYLPFAKKFFIQNKEDEAEYILYLSERMVTWIEEKEDIYFRVRELGMRSQYYESFLKVYEEVKTDIETTFHPIDQPATEFDREKAVWEVYRDVIYAVTQRKFLLIPETEVSLYKKNRILCQFPIKERSDIPKAREGARIGLVDLGVEQSEVMSFLLVISEAITNILKHANEGKMTITLRDNEIYVVVEDKGSGFDLKLLPSMTLITGYSTKRSLGQGFSLMMKMTKRMLLATTPQGSTIVLIFERKEGVGNDKETFS